MFNLIKKTLSDGFYCKIIIIREFVSSVIKLIKLIKFFLLSTFFLEKHSKIKKIL
jgi:hypothetical protein